MTAAASIDKPGWAKAPAPPPALARWPAALLTALGGRIGREWRASPAHRLAIAGPRPKGLAVRPRDPRPADRLQGAPAAAGEFGFAGEVLSVGAGGDPWRLAAPSRRFATWLHGFEWAPDLIAAGDGGPREALRLWLAWRRIFGAQNAFAWSGRALERRVFHLACAAPQLLPLASEAEGAALLDSLARQARHLLAEPGEADRGAERAAAAALAGAALAGAGGERLLERALARLRRLTPEAVLRDGVHASRSPERGLELLFDFLALDDALSQRGAPAPVEVSRAIDRLADGVRFFTLADGRLATFHGGEPGRADRVAAALGQQACEREPPRTALYGGYHRLESPALQVLVDTASPAEDPWSGGACAQLAALAVACEGRRLIEGCGWSAKSGPGGALRGPGGGSSLAVADAWPAARLDAGFLAGPAGERLETGPIEVTAERRHEGQEAWLEVSHDGWRRRFGFMAARRLYLDAGAGELRGDDQLSPAPRARERPTPFEARFQLAAGVAVSIAADGRSALLRPPGGRGWRLRSDARRMRLAPGATFEAGEARAAQVLALSSLADADGGRIRWKLSRDDG
jgi:uncharacterized heparinase superfamily protein